MSEEQDDSRPQAAVALKYDGDRAPTVVAKGEGHLADKIVEIAEQHGVALYKDSELVKLLSRLDLDEEIPNNLYHAVAAVLAFVYKLNGKADDLPGTQKANTQSPLDAAKPQTEE